MSYVYVMRRDDGLRKVGFSSDPNRRRLTLCSQFQQEFEIEQTWEHTRANEIENTVHKRLVCYREQHGSFREFYRADKDIIIAIIQNIIEQLKPAPASTDAFSSTEYWWEPLSPMAVMIRFYRVLTMKSQDELAAELGIKTMTLSRIEAGKAVDQNNTLKITQWLYRRPA